MGKLISAVLGSVLVLLIVGAGPLVWLYDHGATDRWSITLPILFWHPHLGLPRSLAGQLADAKAATKAYADAEKAAEAHARTVEAHQAAVTAQAATHDAQAQAQIVTRYRTIIREVHDVVTPAIDRSYPVPWASVRMFNAGATGLDVSDFPLGAGQSDDQPSPYAASAVADATVANDKLCAANAARLLDLQNWVRDEGMAPK